MAFLLIDAESCGIFGLPKATLPNHVHLIYITHNTRVIGNYNSIAPTFTPEQIHGKLHGDIYLLLGPNHKQKNLANYLRTIGHGVYNIMDADEFQTILNQEWYNDFD